jgi:predicted HTH domain antitoxin
MNLEEFKDVLSRRGIKIKVSGTKEESDKRLKEVFDV